MKDYYLERESRLPVKARYDVLVAGSGPAGFAAAVTAARAGAKTLIVEQGGCIGGISTAGLMSHWTGDVDSSLYREVLARCRDAAGQPFSGDDESRVYIDTERLKLVMLEMLLDAGAEILFYTFLCDAVTEEGRVTGVTAVNKGGRFCLAADVVIDATGDGDIACRAGVAYHVGREQDGKMQPATVMFKVGGVDKDRAVLLGSFESRYQTERGELQALAKKLLPHPAGHVLLYPNPLPGIVTVNMTNCVQIDGTRAEDLTRAEITCRRQIYAIEAFLREYVPGFENCFVVTSASLVGVRETRHFVGMQTLTEEDISSARQFSDWVVRGAYFNFDVHGLDEAGLDATGKQKSFEQTMGYTIPYGCLVPEKLRGLLLAGRNISGTHMAHSNYRAMPICLATGEAAGAAAALSVRTGVSPELLRAEDIRRIYAND